MSNATALYCRLSKDDLSFGESSSISTQKMILKKYVQMKNLTVFDVYIDDGWSGANFDRPGFKRMIADIEAGHINIVVLCLFRERFIDVPTKSNIRQAQITIVFQTTAQVLIPIL